MSKYTPTTEEVRSVWCGFSEYGGLVDRTHSTLWGDRLEEFDRWLAGIKAEVWDECLSQMPFDLDWKIQYGDQNPFRRNEGENE